MNVAPPIPKSISATILHSVIPTSPTRSQSKSVEITISNGPLDISGVIVPEFDSAGNEILIELPDPDILSKSDNSYVFSVIVNIELRDNNLVLEDEIEICFLPISDRYDKDSLCLGF